MTKVSAVIITLNAERTLEMVLKSLHWCDEIVVVDSGSSDKTLDIAAKYKTKIIHQKFLGFGKQKQVGVAAAKNDWVLSVDADEVVSKDLASEIQLMDLLQMNHFGYYIAITNVFMEKIIDLWGHRTDAHLRLFNKKYGNFTDSAVHEKVEVKGTTAYLDNNILHFSYDNLKNYFDKFNAYTTLGAAESQKKNKSVSPLSMVLRIPLKFIQLYILRGAFRHGFPGLVWSVCSAFYPFVKYAKLKELTLAQNRL